MHDRRTMIRKMFIALQKKGYQVNAIDFVQGQWELEIKTCNQPIWIKTGEQPTRMMYGKNVQHLIEQIEQLPEGVQV